MSENYTEAEIDRSQYLIEQVLGIKEVVKLNSEALFSKRVTNVLNLPEPIVRAVTRDNYSKGDAEFSATELLLPPRVRALRRRHRHEIVEDVADVLYRLAGQIGHSILERAGKDSEDIIERRFFADIAGHRVSGQADLIASGDCWACHDYKFTSIWTVKDGPKSEWISQLNILRLLAKLDARIEVPELTVVAIFRDWSKREARRDEAYPQHPVAVLSLPVWPYEETEAFVASRIALHLAAEKNLPECSAEERWAKDDKWRVLKTCDSKRAVPGGVFDSQLEANRFAAKKGWHVVHSPAESVRCESYCEVSCFCSQFAEIQQRDNPEIPF